MDLLNAEWLSLAVLGVLIVISPGADFVLVLKNSLAFGRHAGVFTAIGIGSAISIHIGYSMLGISYLISQNAYLYQIIQYAGAGYLIYLGVKGLCFSDSTSANSTSADSTSATSRFARKDSAANCATAYKTRSPSSTSHIASGNASVKKARFLWQGFLCNALNPKTMLFFLSIFSQIIAPEGQSNKLAYGYGLYMIALHILWFGLIATLVTSPSLNARLQTYKKRLNQLCGLGLLAFGLTLAIRH